MGTLRNLGFEQGSAQCSSAGEGGCNSKLVRPKNKPIGCAPHRTAWMRKYCVVSASFIVSRSISTAIQKRFCQKIVRRKLPNQSYLGPIRRAQFVSEPPLHRVMHRSR